MSSGWRPETTKELALTDSIVGNDPLSGFMQSSFWTLFKKAEGYDVTRFVYDIDDVRIGSAALFRYPLAGEAGFVLCPEGPVLPWANTSTVRTALRELVDIVREFPDTLGLRIEPHLPTPRPNVLRNWADAPTDLTPADTILLDLSLTEQEMLALAHPKCRYNIRTAERHFVEVTATTEISFAHDFYSLLTETSLRTGFFIEPFGFFLTLLEHLFRLQVGELLIARHEGQMLAAILVIYFGRRATYLYGASSSQNRHMMPTHALHREATRRARARGCVEYDMYGIDAFERRDHLYAGITRFKKQWGGRIEQRIGAHDFVFYDRLADRVVSVLASEMETS